SNVYVGGFVVQKRNAAELVIDGSIIANMLSVGSVTTDKLAANSVIAGKIAAGAVNTDQLVAGAVTSAKVAAGAITTNLLAVGQGANFIKNSDFSAGITGWQLEYTNSDFAANWQINLRTDTFVPTPGALEMVQLNGTQGIEMGVSYRKDGAAYDYVSVEAGKWYELSVYYLGHRCNGIQPYVAFVSASGTVLAFANAGIFPANQNIDPGKQLSNYQRAWFKAQAPAGSVYAYVFFRHKGTINGQNDSYLWIHKPFFGEATANQTEPTPWSAAGVTLIQNGNIVAGSVTTDSLAANSVVASKISAGAITTPALAAGSVVGTSIAASTITGANIAAETIGTDKLAANSVTAKQLVLTDFTNLVPDNQIQDFGNSWVGANWQSWTDPYVGGMASRSQARYPYIAGRTGYSEELLGKRFSVQPGVQYRITGTALCPSGNYSPLLRIKWLNSSGGEISIYDFVAGDRSAGVVTTTINLTAPAGAVQAVMAAYVWRTATTGDVYVGGFVVNKRNASELIVDGSITADKLAVNSLSAITANLGTVTAGEIRSSNGKMVISLNAGTIVISS
ncbi:phage tail protein, partial [Agrobacterium vitis]